VTLGTAGVESGRSRYDDERPRLGAAGGVTGTSATGEEQRRV